MRRRSWRCNEKWLTCNLPMKHWLEVLDHGFAAFLVQPLASLFFFDLVFWDNGKPGDANLQLPFVVFWLIAGAAFFTWRFRLINIRGFRHAIAVTRGLYDHRGDIGEVTHFQALSSALSATVGLGNIGGVAVAIGTGGPGAAFWMLVAGFLGMSSKFAECTLGLMYREVDNEGRISGGPMHYLQNGLAEIGSPSLARAGRIMAVLFAIFCVLSSFGMACMFQANQSRAQLAHMMPWFSTTEGSLTFGVAIAVLVGLVSLGGIKRIGAVAGYLVPAMCGLYMLAGLVIIAMHLQQLPEALVSIFRQAWTPEAGAGGILGAMITGFRRAAFSNEAGIGSAPIAHAAATTEEPVREGIVALLEPFIDTVVICSITALVVVLTGAHQHPGEGVVMTSNAFATVLPWFPHVLTVVVILFAYSTMISWSYYGERCWTFLFHPKSSFIYKSMFLVAAVIGSVLPLKHIVSFSDLMLLGMAFINVPGVVLLSGKVKRRLDTYWHIHGRSSAVGAAQNAVVAVHPDAR